MIAGLGCSSLLPPLPTLTPYPTATAFPTYTPYPTTTPWPTHTPNPTATPRPTYTPYPTATRRPTPRPRPTYTRYPTPTPAPNVELPSGIFFAFYEWPRDGQMWHHTSENGTPCVALAYKEQDGLYYPYNGGWGCDFAGYFDRDDHVYVDVGGGGRRAENVYQAIPIRLDREPIASTSLSNEDAGNLLACLAGSALIGGLSLPLCLPLLQ